MRIGQRGLWNGLSRCLAHARAGHTVTVTDHGVPRIISIGMPSALDRLIADGRATPANQPKRPAGRRVTTAGTVSDLVAEQRR